MQLELHQLTVNQKEVVRIDSRQLEKIYWAMVNSAITLSSELRVLRANRSCPA